LTHTSAFADLGLPDFLLAAVDRLGFTTPTPIQAAAIPALLGGEDIVGVAQTGTGKTAAFGLPMLVGILPEYRHPQGLVLVPTRELALQVAGALEDFAAELPGVRVATIYGGAPYYQQIKTLQAGAHIVVGTPGRVIDLLERGTLDLGDVAFVVLDEGDEMLRMGFADDVDRILSEVPAQRQTAIFSATMPPEIRRTVEAHQHNPRQIAVTPQSSTVEGVEQRYAMVPGRHKIGALSRILATSQAQAALVFVRTKASAQEVGAALVERGISASVISGDVPQAEREKVVARLRSGQVTVLVATDVAARGLDVDRIGLVVNFDMPREADEYVHRIGRTGRAGREGVAFSFVTPKERDRVRRIERTTKVRMVETPIPTPADVTAHRVAALLAQVPDRLVKGRLQIVHQAVDGYVSAADDTADSTDERLARAMDLATALAALAVGDDGPASAQDDDLDTDLADLARRPANERPSREHPSRKKAADAARPATGRKHDARRREDSDGDDRTNPSDTHPRADRRYDPDRGDRTNARPRKPRATSGDSRGNRRGSGTTRYWIGVGHRDRIKPGAIVGAITNEGGLRGQDLGAIEMFSNYSTVEIAPELSRQALRRLSQARVAGRTLRLRPDTGRPHRV